MWKKLIAAAILAGCGVVAHAQTSVVLYGIVDATVRYSTHQDAKGDSAFSVGDGAVTGSRFGLRVTEDIGGGYKALAVLENGFTPQNGQFNQGGRLWGRNSYVGLATPYGEIDLGRQYTIAHVAIAKWDVFQLANNSIISFEGSNITGLRNDSMVKYTKQFAGLTISGQYTFGGVAGDINASSVRGVSAIYDGNNFEAGAYYQMSEDQSAVYFGAVSAALASKQTVWGLGGTYTAGPVKLYGHYENNQLNVAAYRNQTFSVGANYTITPAWSILGETYYDRLRHPGPNGNGSRSTTGVVLDYSFSKTSDIYTELDYTKLTGGWVQLANNTALSASSFFGNTNRLGIDIGIRHRF
jgi:predicted porin